ncbi:MAG: UDP-N-acetylmuramoyl-L-alanine--D-glutamate ligase [Spirochaetes bacterium]|nr:UDP-N-acetylmuramoyl-L-alanine--D-glutamate ligase [Spirochaetota bacterium]
MGRKKKIVIMGLGLHGGGVGAANYFIEKGCGVTITDLKKKEELWGSIRRIKSAGNVRFVLGRHELADFENADLVIKNPAVPSDSVYLETARSHGVPVDSDVGVFFDLVKARTDNIVGITGTKGKSTTSALIQALFRRKFPDTVLCGNIAVSVFDVLGRIIRNTYLVMELSSFQLGDIRDKMFSPRIGVFTSFMEDHLDRYRSMEDYFRDKAVLYEWQRPKDVLVYNRDGVLPGLIRPNSGVKVLTFGMSPDFQGQGAYLKNGVVCMRTEEGTREIVDYDRVRLVGGHNRYNILAAVCAAFSEGVPPEDIADEASCFGGLEHRLEWVGERNGVSFYNDSAATNPAAAQAAIKSFSCPITLIAGGSDKGLVLSEFAADIEERVQRLVLLDGSGTRRFQKETGIGGRIFTDFEAAVRHAFEKTAPRGVVLLSPGFASFGMFENEFHRGGEFKRIVREIIKGE